MRRLPDDALRLVCSKLPVPVLFALRLTSRRLAYVATAELHNRPLVLNAFAPCFPSPLCTVSGTMDAFNDPAFVRDTQTRLRGRCTALVASGPSKRPPAVPLANVKLCFPNLQALDLSGFTPTDCCPFEVLTWGSDCPRLDLFVTNGCTFIRSPQPKTTLLQDAAFAISALAAPPARQRFLLNRYFHIRRYVDKNIPRVVSALHTSVACANARASPSPRNRARVVAFFERTRAFTFKTVPGSPVPVPVAWNPSLVSLLFCSLSAFADTILHSLAALVVSASKHAVVDPFLLPPSLFPPVSHALFSTRDPPLDFCRAFAAAAPRELARAYRSLGPRGASAVSRPLRDIVAAAALPCL